MGKGSSPAIVAIALLWSSGAAAQSGENAVETRNPFIGTPDPMVIGGVAVTARATARTSYDSNIDFRPEDPQEDVILVTGATGSARYGDPGRLLQATGFVERRTYAGEGRLSATDAGLQIRSDGTVNRTTLELMADARRREESRTSLELPQNAAGPSSFLTRRIEAALSQDLTAFTLRGEVSLRSRTFEDLKLEDGSTVDQSRRDLDEVEAEAVAAFPLRSSPVSVGLGTRFRQGDANDTPEVPSRDFSARDHFAQIQIARGEILFGVVRLGIRNRDFEDPERRSQDATIATIDLRYRPDRLTDIDIRGEIDRRSTTRGDFDELEERLLGVEIAREIRYDTFVSAGYTVSEAFFDDGAATFDGQALSAGLRKVISPHTDFRLDARYRNRTAVRVTGEDTQGIAGDRERTTISFSLTYRL